jgi:starvation-inducible DNA-binding protein
MEQLLQTIKGLLADNITLSFKSHGYHWNVEGDDFVQFHDFFGKIYDSYNDATDTYAEWLRMLNQYSPYRLVDFFDTSTVGEPEIVGDAQLMLSDLYVSIEKHIADLVIAGKLATSLNEFGLANFFADRQTASQKFCWQIRASIETEDSETLI